MPLELDADGVIGTGIPTTEAEHPNPLDINWLAMTPRPTGTTKLGGDLDII